MLSEFMLLMQADVPTFEVVDLPGIQTYPAEQEKATTRLVSEYLHKPGTLVLCVLDATTTAFDNSAQAYQSSWQAQEHHCSYDQVRSCDSRGGVCSQDF